MTDEAQTTPTDGGQQTPPPTSTQTSNSAPSSAGATPNTGMAIIAYLIFFVPLLTDAKDDPFVKFHVKQALMLIIFWFIISILTFIIPFVGWFGGPLISLGLFVLWVMGIINVANGQKKELPLIGQFAEKWLTF